MITVNHYMALSAVLFVIGVVGVLTRRNVIIVMMSVELMLNAANLLFVTFARYSGDMTGHVFVFMVMAVAAAEAAVGLAITLALFKNRETVDIDEVNLLKG
jgi:NADH-quinone oxidoreductase subunit K